MLGRFGMQRGRNGKGREARGMEWKSQVAFEIASLLGLGKMLDVLLERGMFTRS